MSFTDQGTVLLTNPTVRTLLGYGADEIEGRHVERLLTVAGRIFYQTHLFPLLRLHGRAEEIFLLLRHRDGHEVGALVNVVRVERDGVVVNDLVLMETRERRKYEDALLQAKREAELAHAAAEDANLAKTQFLTTMSHELRTPLNAIGGYAQLLQLGVHGALTDGQRHALERIERSQEHLLRLINEVLNLARIESGRVDFTLEDFPVATVVTSVLPLVEPQMAAGRLRFTSAIADGLSVRADREKTKQVLINLLINAVKFTPAGGTVHLDARADATGSRVLIALTDTGIGIPADQVESIFEPFVQVSGGPARRAEGTGLGLTISRDLARGMHGDLAVTSTVGEGSTFTLALPSA